MFGIRLQDLFRRRSMRKPIFGMLLLVTALGTWGCGKTLTKTADTAPKATPVTNDKSAASDDNANAEIVAALAKLSAEDRAIAEKQKVCPVSGEPLGTMGAPIK